MMKTKIILNKVTFVYIKLTIVNDTNYRSSVLKTILGRSRVVMSNVLYLYLNALNLYPTCPEFQTHTSNYSGTRQREISLPLRK